MKYRIRLDTDKDVADFVGITGKLDGQITVTDGKGLKVNAKSMLGVLYSKMEFEELWCESDHEIYAEIKDFMYD